MNSRAYISQLISIMLFFHNSVDCANILYLAALPSPSHHIFNGHIINTLASRGHNITVLSPDFDELPPKNVHYLKVSEVYEHEELTSYMTDIFATEGTTSTISEYIDVFELCIPLCEG